MKIWRRPYGPRAVEAICEDHPTMQRITNKVRLELIGHDDLWIIELTIGECERIADLIR